MHYLKYITLITCAGSSALLSTGCSSVGYYNREQMQGSLDYAHDRGFTDGVGHQIRLNEHERQNELEKRQIKETYYRIPVSGHTTEDGIIIEPHVVPIRIITD